MTTQCRRVLSISAMGPAAGWRKQARLVRNTLGTGSVGAGTRQ